MFLRPTPHTLTKVLSCLAIVCLMQVFLKIWSKPRMAPWALEILKAFTVAAVPGYLAVADTAAASSDRDYHPARFLALVGVGPSLPSVLFPATSSTSTFKPFVPGIIFSYPTETLEYT